MKKFGATLMAVLLVCVMATGQQLPDQSGPDQGQAERKCISGDCENGKGTYVIDGPNGQTTYMGSFVNGLEEGTGTMISADSSVYKGEWKKGTLEGKGTLVFNNGKVSTGIWKDGKLWSGTGYFSFGPGEYYYGGVNENMPDGQGAYFYNDGKSFTGTFSLGNPVNGKGYLYFTSDSVGYEGTIVNGHFSGMGIYTNPKGQVFTGNFDDGTINGEGSWTAPDGRTYIGNFKDGDFYGYGVMTFGDGSVYKGNWAESKRNGTGSYFDANGLLDYNGEWSNDEMVNPPESVSYKTKLWEDAQQMFSRITFLGWQEQTIDDEKGYIDITDEFHLSSDFTFEGKETEVITIGDTKYREEIDISGTYDPVAFTIHIDEGESSYQDELPEGLYWTTDGTDDGTIYDDVDNPGYHIIKGKTGNGSEFELSDHD